MRQFSCNGPARINWVLHPTKLGSLLARNDVPQVAGPAVGGWGKSNQRCPPTSLSADRGAAVQPVREGGGSAR